MSDFLTIRITGAPASGKTILARRLAALLAGEDNVVMLLDGGTAIGWETKDAREYFGRPRAVKIETSNDDLGPLDELLERLLKAPRGRCDATELLKRLGWTTDSQRERTKIFRMIQRCRAESPTIRGILGVRRHARGVEYTINGAPR